MNKSQLLQSLKSQGFSKQIIDGFSKVKREDFFPEELKSQAYEDEAFPIGNGQTISQPYTIATMLSLLELEKGQKALEIGSGCGYVLALISEITKQKVYGIERIKELAEKSKENLKNSDAEVYCKNGYNGLSEKFPFDRILISAALKEIPKPLLSQLKEKGILVAPVGSSYSQSLVAVQRKGNKFVTKKEISGFIFVPFIEED